MNETRRFCRGLAPLFVLILVLSGCSGDSPQSAKDTPPPMSLEAPEQCDVCGMVIEEHHGPSGQIYYDPGDLRHDTNPFQFDSIKHGLLPHYLGHRQMGWSTRVIYVTDYSRVDYSVESVDGTTYIQTAVAPDDFAPVDQVVFVVGSQVHGAMGADYIPFSDREQAEQFADTYGGRLRQFEALTENRAKR